MMTNNLENIQEKKDINPFELATFVQNHPELAITGSVAFYLQTGLSFDEAIEKANDIDIFCDVETQPEILEEKRKIELGEKRVTVLSQQEHFKFKTSKEDFIENDTEYGPIRLVPIKIMAILDMERGNYFLNNEEYKFDIKNFTKLYKKLNNYKEVIQDKDLKEKLEVMVEEFSKHLAFK